MIGGFWVIGFMGWLCLVAYDCCGCGSDLWRFDWCLLFGVYYCGDLCCELSLLVWLAWMFDCLVVGLLWFDMLFWFA